MLAGTPRIVETGGAIGSAVVGGTAGSVLFVGATNLLAQDATNFVLDSGFPTLTGSSGTKAGLTLGVTVNQSGTASSTSLLINTTVTAAGSGSTILTDWQVGGVSVAGVYRLASYTKYVGREIGDTIGQAVGAYFNFNQSISGGIQGQATTIQLQTNNSNTVIFRGGVSEDTVIRGYAGQKINLTSVASTTGSPTVVAITSPADTTLTASTESIAVNVNLSATRQFSTGALTTQREMLIQAPTYGFVGASTITTAGTLVISGAPIAGTNATITNSYALWLQTGGVKLDSTITAPGTTTTQTINKPTGRINIAAAGTTATVNNSLVTANSIILVVAATADATARVTNVVPGAGSFVINTAAVTAETAFNFLVIS